MTDVSEQHKMLLDSSNLRKQQYEDLESQLRQSQNAINQAQNERRQVSHIEKSRGATKSRLLNKLLVNKQNLTGYEPKRPICGPRKNSGRSVPVPLALKPRPLC